MGTDRTMEAPSSVMDGSGRFTVRVSCLFIRDIRVIRGESLGRMIYHDLPLMDTDRTIEPSCSVMDGSGRLTVRISCLFIRDIRVIRGYSTSSRSFQDDLQLA